MFAVIRKNRLILSAVFAALILIAIIVGIYSLDNKTNDTVVDFLHSHGWEVSEAPLSMSHLTIPTEFDEVYKAYNEIQLESKLDLSPHKGHKAERLSYKVLNHTYSESQTVLANVIYCNEESIIIGADVSGTEPDSFMHAVNDTAQLIVPQE